MANTTGIAVGCAIGIPTFVALCIAFFFVRKNKRRLVSEDVEFQRDHEIRDIDRDLEYDNMDQLKSGEDPDANMGPMPQEHITSEDSDCVEKAVEDSKQEQQKKKARYVPAYRKQMKSNMSLNNSRNSSYSNLNPPTTAGSNASINTNSTTDNFYSNVPVMGMGGLGSDSDQGSIPALARTLQTPTPSYSKRPALNRGNSSHSTTHESDNEYDLKNNYQLDNDGEIQEEDQYENEFTNYSANKRAFIEGLRPKPDN